MLRESWRRYGDLTRLSVPWSVPKYLVVHPDQVRQVLLDRSENYRKTSLYRELESITGPTIFTTEGEAWHHRRRLAQPAFRRDQVATSGPIVAGLTSSMLDRWARAAEAGQDLDLPLEMTRLALSIAAGALFRADLAGELDALARGLPIIQRHLTRRMKGYADVPNWLPLPSHQRYLAVRRLLRSLSTCFIAERRALTEDPADLLSILLRDVEDAAGPSLTEDELRSEVSAYLLAGHEIGHGLTWAWYLLARHPQVEQRLHAELAAVLGGRAPTVEDLPDLQYTLVSANSDRLG
jgi:cytochrome P450